MKIYWSLANVPELSSLNSDERNKIHRECLKRHFFHAPMTRWSVAAYLSFLVCPVLAIVLADLFCSVFGISSSWTFIFAVILGSYIGSDIFSFIAINYLRRFYSGHIQRMENGITA